MSRISAIGTEVILSAMLTTDKGSLQNRNLILHMHGLNEWPRDWLVREIFGHPFRPFQMLPEWRTADVLGLANKAYDERKYDLLPVLADAMEEAGCQNLEFLIHLRSEGRHVRGCWALDAILGKTSLTPPNRQSA
jgi:hypothetical protein